MRTLYLCRHGNTFAADETPRWIGSATDIPLTEGGEQQARALGKALSSLIKSPVTVYGSVLKRAARTAHLIGEALSPPAVCRMSPLLNEIAFGPWEGRTTEDLAAAYGPAYTTWQQDGTYPVGCGWQESEEALRLRAQLFILQLFSEETPGVIAVTSNGMARFFARHNPAAFQKLAEDRRLKMPTGSVSCLVYQTPDRAPEIRFWGKAPHDFDEKIIR